MATQGRFCELLILQEESYLVTGTVKPDHPQRSVAHIVLMKADCGCAFTFRPRFVVFDVPEERRIASTTAPAS